MSWKSIDEMYRYFGECLSEEDYEKEKRWIEEFLGNCKDYEFLEDTLYGELFIIRKEDEYYLVSDWKGKFDFDKLDEEDVERL